MTWTERSYTPNHVPCCLLRSLTARVAVLLRLIFTLGRPAGGELSVKRFIVKNADNEKHHGIKKRQLAKKKIEVKVTGVKHSTESVSGRPGGAGTETKARS